MEDSKKTRNKKKHTGRNVTIGAAAALLLLLGGYMGFGQGLGLGSGSTLLPNESATKSDNTQQAILTNAPEAAVTEVPATQEPEAEPENNTIVVSVQESRILIDGEEVSLTSLESALKGAVTDGKQVKLQDDHAIKATYDTVVSVLQKLDIPFVTGD